MKLEQCLRGILQADVCTLWLFLSQPDCSCLHLAHCQAQVNEPDDRYITLAQAYSLPGTAQQGWEQLIFTHNLHSLSPPGMPCPT